MAKDYMLSIKMRSGHTWVSAILSFGWKGVEGLRRNEELRSVRVGSSIRHGEQHGLLVLYWEPLIFELLAIDTFSACTVSSGKVPALQHEPSTSASLTIAMSNQSLPLDTPVEG